MREGGEEGGVEWVSALSAALVGGLCFEEMSACMIHCFLLISTQFEGKTFHCISQQTVTSFSAT